MAATTAMLLRSAMSSLGIETSASLEVRNESRNSCHFHPVVGGSNAIPDEGKFALDLGKLVSEALAVVVIVVVAFNLGDRIPVVKV